MMLQGKDAVPDTVDHVLVRVDPKEDRTWLQSEPAVSTDNAHALDKTGAEPLVLCGLYVAPLLSLHEWAACTRAYEVPTSSTHLWRRSTMLLRVAMASVEVVAPCPQFQGRTSTRRRTGRRRSNA